LGLLLSNYCSPLFFTPMYTHQNRHIQFHNIGLVDYQLAWDYQKNLFDSIVSTKKANRNQPEYQRLPTANHLIFCSHPHVYTLGKSGSLSNLLLNEAELAARNIQFYNIGRGGDITYHGPGQIIGYPILDLDNFFTDLHKFLRLLEEAIILTLADYGLQAGRIVGATGVWLDPDDLNKARKICAMGIRCSRWVSMHGWAFNVNTDLSYFKHIIPCGIDDKAVTSLHTELGVAQVNITEVQDRLKQHFAHLFEAQLVNVSSNDI
jgi:lipoyl(octanoyl) transferase